MGKVIAKVKLANVRDLNLAEEGVIQPHQVRQCEIEALADSGASLMCLPEDVVEQLGLKPFASKMATLATGEARSLPIARTIRIRIGDREADQDCVVLPRGAQPLIGHFVMQEMDLAIDMKRDRLVPAHPDAEYPVIDLL
jgi:clan AA aspartic protease